VGYDECFEVHPLKLYPEEGVYPEETGISVKETLIYLCQMARFVRLPTSPLPLYPHPGLSLQ